MDLIIKKNVTYNKLLRLLILFLLPNFLFNNIIFSFEIKEFYTEFFNKGIVKVPIEDEAYNYLKKYGKSIPATYIAVPWSAICKKKLINLLSNISVHKFYGDIFTVCYWHNYKDLLPIMKKMGIKKVFTPHAKASKKTEEGISIIPIPYIAMIDVKPALQKKYLYSFVGDDSHPVRNKISHIIKNRSDVVLQIRETFHFFLPPLQRKKRELEYKDILSKSRFSLCPRGVSTGNIRFWESLQAGAIPILISDDMALPKGFDWHKCVIFIKEKDVDKIDSIIRSISIQKEDLMRSYALEAYEQFSKSNWLSSIFFEYCNNIC